MAFLFPAHACRYYFSGICVYAETLNPGLNPAFLCQRLAGLMNEWDDYLDRAEAFDLEEGLAFKIWEKRAHRALNSSAVCPDELRNEGRAAVGMEKTLPDCPHIYDGACLIAMPRCNGYCAHFSKAGG